MIRTALSDGFDDSGSAGRCSPGSFVALGWNLHCEGRAFSEFALDGYNASDHSAETPRYAEAQSRSAIVASGGRVCLRKSVKEPFLLLRRHPDPGVGHFEY